jgi:histidinol-phosphate aminotransferase
MAGARRVVARVEAEHGVRLRAYPATRAVGEGVRVGVGPWPLMERALDALRAVVGADANGARAMA